MRRLLPWSCLLLLLAMPFAARADGPAELEATDEAAIRQVIEAQLAAFRRDDGSAAFSFASPQIQAIFKDPAHFMAMVRGGYAAVYRPQEIEFQDLTELRGQPMQPVLLVGPDSQVVIAYYFMEKQPGGEWRIDGCTLGPAQGQSAI
jgi:hypothetical protein